MSEDLEVFTKLAEPETISAGFANCSFSLVLLSPYCKKRPTRLRRSLQNRPKTMTILKSGGLPYILGQTAFPHFRRIPGN